MNKWIQLDSGSLLNFSKVKEIFYIKVDQGWESCFLYEDYRKDFLLLHYCFEVNGKDYELGEDDICWMNKKAVEYIETCNEVIIDLEELSETIANKFEEYLDGICE